MPVLSRFYGIVIRMYFYKRNTILRIFLGNSEFQASSTIGVRRYFMFHKIKNISTLPEYRLSVRFAEGCTKVYDMNPLFERISYFTALKDPRLF